LPPQVTPDSALAGPAAGSLAPASQGEAAARTADLRGYRLSAIDMLRGLVVVIMALDHVRDFTMLGTEQDPMANPNITAALFVTRWITHFCAPVFVLLAGVSAGLMAERRGRPALAMFLLVRGLWLVFIEIFIISTMVTFSPRGVAEVGGALMIGMQVIWAIGASMIVLAALQYFGRAACLAIGLAILAGHNLLDPLWPKTTLTDLQWPLWVALHAQMSYRAGPFLFMFVYPVLAWIGVMLAGFGISGVFARPADRRNALLLRAGLMMTAAFILLRAVDIYGDPNPWQVQSGGVAATIIDFLNTTKYPPSLLFLLMTLGPAAMLCAIADRLTGGIKNTLVMFGRVPFAFYVAHFLLIHVIAVLLGVGQGFAPRQLATFFFFFPKGYGVGLPWVYAIWALVVILLYPFCRWVASVKTRRRDWWLSYV